MTHSVSLENYSGPLDLLLHLIQQEEVEIHEIPIAVICDRFLESLRNLDDLDVDLASEFLVMASTLMLIKSRALLPAGEEVDLEEELDPEDELIQQLLEYKQFKLASRDLEELARGRTRIFPLTVPELPKDELEIELEELDLWDLVRAFATMLQETNIGRAPRLIDNEKPIREYLEEVFQTVREHKSVTFRTLFEGAADRTTLIGRFLALLELVKRQLVRSVQVASFDQIEIVLVDDRELSTTEILNMEAELLAPEFPEFAELPEAPEAPGAEEELEFQDPLDKIDNDLERGNGLAQRHTRRPDQSSPGPGQDAEVSHG